MGKELRLFRSKPGDEVGLERRDPGRGKTFSEDKSHQGQSPESRFASWRNREKGLKT